MHIICCHPLPNVWYPVAFNIYKLHHKWSHFTIYHAMGVALTKHSSLRNRICFKARYWHMCHGCVWTSIENMFKYAHALCTIRNSFPWQKPYTRKVNDYRGFISREIACLCSRWYQRFKKFATEWCAPCIYELWWSIASTPPFLSDMVSVITKPFVRAYD